MDSKFNDKYELLITNSFMIKRKSSVMDGFFRIFKCDFLV